MKHSEDLRRSSLLLTAWSVDGYRAFPIQSTPRDSHNTTLCQPFSHSHRLMYWRSATHYPRFTERHAPSALPALSPSLPSRRSARHHPRFTYRHILSTLPSFSPSLLFQRPARHHPHFARRRPFPPSFSIQLSALPMAPVLSHYSTRLPHRSTT